MALFKKTIFAVCALAAFASLCAPHAFAEEPELVIPYKEFVRGEKVFLKDPLSVDGAAVSINKDLGKKVVVLAFWLNTCDLCFERMKELRAVISKNKLEKKVAVYTIARASTREEKRMVAQEMKESGLSWPVIADPDLAISKQFVVTMVPAFHIIAADRTLLTRQMHTVTAPVRNLSLEDMILMAVRGESVPAIEFQERRPDEIRSGLLGKQAPDFTASDLFGDSFSLSDYKNKKPVLLIFWHPTCPPCVQAMPYFQDHIRALSRKYDFAVLSVANIKGAAQERETKTFIQRYDLPFPVLNDADAAIGTDYEINHIPAMIFISTDGRIEEIESQFKGEIGTLIDPVISRLAAPLPEREPDPGQ